MNYYTGIWYTPDRAVKEEPEPVYAASAEEARLKFMAMYPEDKRPAPFISIMPVET